MAARDRTWTPDKVRQKIRTSMLINRLQNHVLGRIEMTKSQVSAAGMLLKKTLPDMIAQSVERRPLESMADDELLATLQSIRSYLAAQGTGAGANDPPEAEPACALPTVQ
jgi:hypothetical protein